MDRHSFPTREAARGSPPLGRGRLHGGLRQGPLQLGSVVLGGAGLPILQLLHLPAVDASCHAKHSDGQRRAFARWETARSCRATHPGAWL